MALDSFPTPRPRFEPVGTSWRLRAPAPPPAPAAAPPSLAERRAAAPEGPFARERGWPERTPAPAESRPIRVMLIDDHAALREPLALLIDREPGMAVAGQAGSLAEARRAFAAGVAADVVLLDLHLPDGNGVDLIKEIRAANPRGEILILTATDDPQDQARAVQAGASGVFSKTRQIADIIGAVRKLGSGQPICPPGQIIELLRLANAQRERDEQAPILLGRLTPREREVLGALADGLSDKEIALQLNVSNKTVRVHMANILDKLGLESRLQALIFAVRHGLVEIR